MDFAQAVALHIKPIDVTVLLMTFYCLLLWDFYVFRTVPYISHSIHYGNGMAQLHAKIETHHYGNTTYFEPFLSIPILSKPTAADMGFLWATKDYPLPYHPSILQLIWDCYRLKTTIPFAYYPSILQLIWKYCYRSQSTISLPYHLLVFDIGIV